MSLEAARTRWQAACSELDAAERALLEAEDVWEKAQWNDETLPFRFSNGSCFDIGRCFDLAVIDTDERGRVYEGSFDEIGCIRGNKEAFERARPFLIEFLKKRICWVQSVVDANHKDVDDLEFTVYYK